MTQQIYEKYWNLTLAWTDFNGKIFLSALKIIVDFIDKEQQQKYSKSYYEEIQAILIKELGLGGISVRKGINEFVKLGFIDTKLLSYPQLTKEYLNAVSDEERNPLFSQIVYSNSSFQRSVTKDSNIREINFVVKSLEKMEILPESLIGAMIYLNIGNYPEGYVTRTELERVNVRLEKVGFVSRKYNQISYMVGLLKKLNGIIYDNDAKYFRLEQESDRVVEPKTKESHIRDPYLQRLYKVRLQQESKHVYGTIKCMVEGLEYPYMIASHIKPYKSCYSENEAFDAYNGLLLSKNVDALFDKNYISFDDSGNIIFYDKVPNDIKKAWGKYKIKSDFMNKERRKYLEEHRRLCLLSNQ